MAANCRPTRRTDPRPPSGTAARAALPRPSEFLVDPHFLEPFEQSGAVVDPLVADDPPVGDREKQDEAIADRHALRLRGQTSSGRSLVVNVLRTATRLPSTSIVEMSTVMSANDENSVPQLATMASRPWISPNAGLSAIASSA